MSGITKSNMKGVICEKQGGQLKLVDDVEKPKPGPDQLLVKSLWLAMQPVYAMFSIIVRRPANLVPQ